MQRIIAILATVKKEWLVLRRDVAGLLMLLLMPAALIVIMALVQDAPFKDYQNIRFDLLLANEDGGPLAREITKKLKESNSFKLIDSVDGKPVTANYLMKSLQDGTQQVGILIPKGASNEVANSANILANSIAEKMGAGRLPTREPRDSVAIKMFFDPVSRPTFRMAIMAALEKYVTAASSQLLVSKISKLAGAEVDSSGKDAHQLAGGIRVREAMLNKQAEVPNINSVQHNVPAWAIFGMFFIVVPLSGQIIREREEGSALRIRLIPGADISSGIGRILFYTIICCAQFLLMCAVGRWLLPLFGLPALTLGVHPFALLPVILCTAICATSYGYFIGTVFRTGAQALPFGAISIVILSALGGIWVPIDLLPKALQLVANISPLHWALVGVQNIILRDGSWATIALPSMVMLALSVALWAIASISRKKKLGGF